MPHRLTKDVTNHQFLQDKEAIGRLFDYVMNYVHHSLSDGIRKRSVKFEESCKMPAHDRKFIVGNTGRSVSVFNRKRTTNHQFLKKHSKSLKSLPMLQGKLKGKTETALIQNNMFQRSINQVSLRNIGMGTHKSIHIQLQSLRRHRSLNTPSPI